MKTILLIKSQFIRSSRLTIIKNNEKIVFRKNESKKSISLETEDTIIIKQQWVSSRQLNYHFFKHDGCYEIKPALNNTWIAVIFGSIIILTMTTYPRVHDSFLIAITPGICLSMYIFSYLTVFRKRYFKIIEI